MIAQKTFGCYKCLEGMIKKSAAIPLTDLCRINLFRHLHFSKHTIMPFFLLGLYDRHLFKKGSYKKRSSRALSLSLNIIIGLYFSNHIYRPLLNIITCRDLWNVYFFFFFVFSFDLNFFLYYLLRT